MDDNNAAGDGGVGGRIIDGEKERKDIKGTPTITVSDQSKRQITTPRLAQTIFKPHQSPNVPFPSPLPLLSLSAATIPPHLRRQSISRRRSSYPPAGTPGLSSSSNLFPWVVGGTPGAGGNEFGSNSDTFPGFGNEVAGSMESWNGANGWESLLTFDTDVTKLCQPVEVDQTKSDPSFNQFPKVPVIKSASDMAYKTILDSVVDVETIGQIGVVQILQEIWNRGGGDTVTSRCLWPDIITALSPSSKPSAQAALALQTLYNLTIRQWESTVFSGLLSTYSSSLPSFPALPDKTPTKVVTDDFDPWTNATPGIEWSSLTSFFGSTGLTPKAGTPARRASGVRGSISSITADYFDDPQDGGVRGLDDLLTMMEDEKHERALEAANMVCTTVSSPCPPEVQGKSEPTFQLPTPPTDSSISPSCSNSSVMLLNLSNKKRKSLDASGNNEFSPQSIGSPYHSASSGSHSNSTYSISAISQCLDTSRSLSLPPVLEDEAISIDPALVLPGITIPSSRMANRAGSSSQMSRPMKVEMPTMPFVPPPPMCMFFSPAFKDLQKGKVGVWKGDLEVRGRGGGRFSVLIVGEEGTGHVWQSHLWPTTISYPQDPAPANSSCTSSMIPVANLAREGYMPIAMGMVLCNDERISEYVAMVQGFHAEGVAFHLPGLTRLPIVFLPAKFDSSDTLQRLGIAFMSKDRILPPAPTIPFKNGSKETVDGPAPKRRKSRRQSTGSTAVEGGHRKRVSLGGGGKHRKIEEGDES